MSIFRKYKEHLTDVLYIWREELKQVIKDEGVLMFLVIVPLGYPLLYSWIYNNESLHETPVVVVDQSHSALSRQFINDCDASSDVHIAYYAEIILMKRARSSVDNSSGVSILSHPISLHVSVVVNKVLSVYIATCR